jgi:N-acetylneuraminate lyase
MKKLEGIIPALLTPFDSDGNVNEKETRKLIRFLIDKGSAGFFVCGSTGEGLLLSMEERKKVCEIAVSETAGQIPIIVHVGTLATQDAVELTRHAYKTGASAVGSIPPIYYGYDIKGIVQYYKSISESAEMPVYVYYIPDKTGAKLLPSQYIEEISVIPNLAGIKFSDYNLFNLQTIVSAVGDEINVLSGYDEIFAAGLIMGAHGGIGSNYNIMPDQFLGVYENFKKNRIEEVQEIQTRINKFVTIMIEYGLPMLKHTMTYHGIECGDCRAPLPVLTDEQKKDIDRRVTEIGFFEWPEFASNKCKVRLLK